MDHIGLKKKYSPLKMVNITVIKLKPLAQQRGSKGYYTLRNAELIQELETDADVNEEVVIPDLKNRQTHNRISVIQQDQRNS